MKQFRFIWYQLNRPFSYLRIKHEDKWIYDWVIPGALTIVTIALAFCFVETNAVFSSDGIISKLTDFVAGLPGFFIAALAAVATFNKNDIDDLMANPPKLAIMYQGQEMLVDMTRRRFLCVLFSYLTAASIFLVLVTRFALHVSGSGILFEYLCWAGAALYFFTLWQIVLATLLGLFYLGERLHTPHQ